MDRDSQTTWIKRGPHRSIAVRSAAAGGSRLVKRYRARGLLRRFGDRRRAQNEFRMLRALRQSGLRVPEPYELRRVGDGWELSCEWIPGARSLLELLRSPRGLPAPPEVLARQLGALVGAAHALGLVHHDLHAGNLLVDPVGQPWMIDFTHARLLQPPSPDVLRSDIVALAADAREFTSPALRRRFLVAWRAALGARPVETLGEFFQGVEELARLRRRDVLLEHEDRWVRASGLCDEVELGGRKTLVARTVGGTDEQRRDLALSCLGLAAGEAIPGLGTAEVLQVDEEVDALDSWRTLGRLWQHGLPGLIPLALVRAPRPRGFFRSPRGGAPLSTLPRIRGARVAALDRLLALLRDRGLALVGERGLWCTPEGELLLGPGCDLRTEPGDGRSIAARQ